jgi:hypothetical protein
MPCSVGISPVKGFDASEPAHAPSGYSSRAPSGVLKRCSGAGVGRGRAHACVCVHACPFASLHARSSARACVRACEHVSMCRGHGRTEACGGARPKWDRPLGRRGARASVRVGGTEHEGLKHVRLAQRGGQAWVVTLHLRTPCVPLEYPEYHYVPPSTE